MCQASRINAHDILGPLILLQLWIRDRFPFIAPMRLHSAPHDGVLPQPPLGMWYVFNLSYNICIPICR